MVVRQRRRGARATPEEHARQAQLAVVEAGRVVANPEAVLLECVSCCGR